MSRGGFAGRSTEDTAYMGHRASFDGYQHSDPSRDCEKAIDDGAYPDDNNDHVEDMLSGGEAVRRYTEEGNEENLSELAAPPPINRTRIRHDSLEQEEVSARKHHKHAGISNDGTEFLSEVAVPPPVERLHSYRFHRSRSLEKVSSSHNAPWQTEAGTEENPRPVEDKHSVFLTEFYIHSYLVVLSMLGLLARLGIEAIGTYPNAPSVPSSLWANFGGSLFLRFPVEARRFFRKEWGSQKDSWSSFGRDSDHSQDEQRHQEALKAHKRTKKTIPLFIGLSVGFCGSFTSFSFYIRDVFLALSNDLPQGPLGRQYGVSQSIPRDGAYSFAAALAVLILHVVASAGALQLGAHVAMGLDPVMPTMPFKLLRTYFDPLIAFLAWGCYLGAIILSIWYPKHYWRGRALFSVVFAPPGCLLRFYASKYLNDRIPSFPLGTFVVNILGTVVLGACFDLQRFPSSSADANESVVACQILEGLMEGFCGCLTTVSTWVAELNGLHRRHAYLYGGSSLAVALGFLVVIMGSLRWTKGFDPPACD